ncbi:MAG: xanthine dehydrogenase family protein molybdopterin-binding subunit [Alphaproteobacteria bacterium]|nr:xanthine dehydrogenase family protein molybdopterin-binding subunit [Alphaproteobacteria bacterium]
MTLALDVSRRGFLAGSAAVAGGFSLGFHIPMSEAAAQGAAPEVNAWVVIRPDDSVSIRVARTEMGQGTITGLCQLVAEELECDWAKVSYEYPTPGQNLARNRVWGNFQTAGSQGIRQSHEYVRKGGAAARMMLIQAAAKEWNVSPEELRVAKGVITHAASGRSTTYGKVADAAAKIEPPKEVPLKDPKTWTIAGKPVARLDTVDKTNGKQVYGLDFTLPGMLNAAVRACPVYQGKLKSFDAASVTGMRGVKKVVAVGDNAVAVVADTWWRAKTALDALKVEWDLGANANASSEATAAMLREGLDAKEAFEGNKAGDADAAIAAAARKVEAVYSVPHQHHATMEPMNATARWTPERCEVWCPTQNGEAAFATAVAASGLQPTQCEAYRINLGGGFGRRATSHDYVRQAVLIAKEMPGTPIKLIWSREEDMLHGWYHPVTMCKLTGALDANGNMTALKMRISGQSILATVNPNGLQNGRDPITFQGLNPGGAEGRFGYSIPNLMIDHAMRNPPLPAGFWRGVNNNQNAIYLECFMDEMAHAAGQDQLEFRRKLLGNSPKHLAVLNAVAEKAGWGKPAAPGVFRGLAQHMGYGSYVAACAEVSVSAQGQVKIHRIVAATDCGHAVNPQQIAAQIEGSFVYGLSAMMHQEITIKDGKVEQENFDSYPCMLLDEMPVVESIVIPSGDFWGGVGEPTIFVAAPAVLNAIFAATGKRVRNLPLKNNDLRKA